MNIEDILNHPKIEESKEMVNNINGDMIGRIALNQGAQATHVLYIVKELLGDKCKRVLDIGTLWGGSIITMMQSEYKSHFLMGIIKNLQVSRRIQCVVELTQWQK